MSQEFVSVPRDWLTQVSLMQMSHEELQDQAVGFLCEPCDEPVPPAGGDLEVLASIWHGAPGEAGLLWSYVPAPAGFVRKIDLIDRAHVTRLQAENAALQQRLNIADQRVDELQSESFEALYNAAIEERDAAQSEMAKATAWLKHAKPLLHSGGFNLAASDIGNFLADQSAPAAKDGA